MLQLKLPHFSWLPVPPNPPSWMVPILPSLTDGQWQTTLGSILFLVISVHFVMSIMNYASVRQLFQWRSIDDDDDDDHDHAQSSQQKLKSEIINKKESEINKKQQTMSKRRTSMVFTAPVLGNIALGTSRERRLQTLAMFSCSLAFIMPASVGSMTLTLYLLLVGWQHLQTENWTYYNANFVVPVALILYLIFTILDTSATTGTRRPWLRSAGGLGSWWWAKACDFLPVVLVKTADLPAFREIEVDDENEKEDKKTSNKTKKKMIQVTQKYVMGYHPHGIIAVGAFCAFATNGPRILDFSDSRDDKELADKLQTRGFEALFPNLDRRVVTLPQNFWTPFLREYFLSLGAITSAKETFRSYLQTGKPAINTDNAAKEQQGRAMIVVVGGAAESMLADPGEINLILGRRRGFVREAIMAQANLVPVLGFGETNLYELYEADAHVGKLQRFVKSTFGFAMPLFRGRSIFLRDIGVMPKRTPVVVVVGQPIPPPTQLPDKKQPHQFAPKICRDTDEPLNEDGKILLEWHAKYVEGLEALYNKYKDATWNMPGKSRAKSLKIVR